ncbi:DUF2243 domain-containing protein [Planococcus shenhongbingii]|uniref:DUF2243 domain-containing protein n=1 Tax=Planococcus shenhongbingii TaxID=3058398 RepID=A0ABT8NAW8_9BACL|nr:MULTISPECIES: DUF2243 domain-containing protein [unclassified Planococcus (in: firmicutes)]MDN7245036.1 DUF2243 domain-containing protein [Planococcus sp. N017]WKA58133.1 DUF2243 domain-containing protein [Planococcus sp. N016]
MVATNDGAKAYVNGKNRKLYSTRNLWSGVLFGLGLAAFVDETVFHQLLHWHHFYDQSTSNIGLVSDGLFHAFSWFATIASLFLFADLRRRDAFWLKRWLGGLFFGTGAFQLYDGTIQHKLLRLHQIRYNVDILPYDVAWNIIALILLIIGGILLWKTRKLPERTGS